MTSRKEESVLPLYFPKTKRQQNISCTDSAEHFPDPRKEDRKTTILLLSATTWQNSAEPGNNLGSPEIAQGYT